jgi:predicted dehydrogenase
MLQVGVIGLGVGRQHALAYAALEDCSVVALCDRNFELARTVGREVGAERVTDDYRALLTDARLDLVSIASQDDDHYEHAMAALGAGKHVFVEKPLCRSGEEAAAIKARWLDGGRHLASNLVLRAAPLYRWLRAAIAGGELGTVYAFDGDYLYGRVHKITEGWRKDVDDYSVMQGGGIHLLDLMLWLTGERPETVASVGSRVVTQGTAFRYDDFAAATFRFPSGLIGRITANFGCVHRHHHVVRVFGTKGTFIYDDCGARLHGSRNPEAMPQRIDHAPLPGSKGDLIPAFVQSVRASGDPVAAGQHEFDVVSVCLAADRARVSGQTERVTYV